MKDKIQKLKEIIDSSKNLVLFSGAGISVTSGIPDFRSADGLYNGGLTKYGVSPETVISHHFYKLYPEMFFEFFKENMVFKDAKPNVAHNYFAELEKKNKLKAVVTQNIDGLHEKAGNKTVFNIHGNVFENYCEDCLKKYGVDYVLNAKGVPFCEKCGGIVRPNVVLYEEGLDQTIYNNAIETIAESDTLIVVGSSLVVQPAASLVGNYFKGENLVLINLQKTPYDKFANLVINEKIEKVVEELHNLEKQKN